MVTMLSMTLIAVGAAVAAWLRPLPHDNGQSIPPNPAPAFTDQQIVEAKANVCNAYNATMSAVRLNTNRPDPVPGDVIGSLAAAAHARLALYAGGDYLLDRLAEGPATPTELANPIRSLGETLKEAGIISLSNEENSALDPFRNVVDTDAATIEQLCK